MNKKIIILILFWNIFNIFLFPQDKGTLIGFVYSKVDNNEPVQGCNLLLYDKDNNFSGLGAKSDRDGYFIIPNIPVGNWKITSSYVGFTKQNIKSVPILENHSTFVVFELSNFSPYKEEENIDFNSQEFWIPKFIKYYDSLVYSINLNYKKSKSVELINLLVSSTTKSYDYVLGIDNVSAMRILVWAFANELNENLRSDLKEAIIKVGKPIIPFILDHQSYFKKRNCLYEIIDVFNELKDPRTIPFLTKLISYANPTIRKKTAETLGNFDEKEAIDALKILLRDVDQSVRFEAANSLFKHRYKSLDNIGDSVYYYVSLSNKDWKYLYSQSNSNDEKIVILSKLMSIFGIEKKLFSSVKGEERALEPLVSLLNLDGSDTRIRVLEILKSKYPDNCTDYIIASLKDKDERVRLKACDLLGDLESEKSIEYLIELVKNENKYRDRYVKEAALNALRKIGSTYKYEYEDIFSSFKDEDLIVGIGIKNKYTYNKTMKSLGFLFSYAYNKYYFADKVIETGSQLLTINSTLEEYNDYFEFTYLYNFTKKFEYRVEGFKLLSDYTYGLGFKVANIDSTLWWGPIVGFNLAPPQIINIFFDFGLLLSSSSKKIRSKFFVSANFYFGLPLTRL